jgi:hypothetical protein
MAYDAKVPQIRVYVIRTMMRDGACSGVYFVLAIVCNVSVDDFRSFGGSFDYPWLRRDLNGHIAVVVVHDYADRSPTDRERGWDPFSAFRPRLDRRELPRPDKVRGGLLCEKWVSREADCRAQENRRAQFLTSALSRSLTTLRFSCAVRSERRSCKKGNHSLRRQNPRDSQSPQGKGSRPVRLQRQLHAPVRQMLAATPPDGQHSA